MKRVFLLFLFSALVLGGCAVPNSGASSNTYLNNLHSTTKPGFQEEFRTSSPEVKREIIQLYAAYNSALNSPRMLYHSKLAEADGLYLVFRNSTSSTHPFTNKIFADLSRYMGTLIGGKYLHDNVDPTIAAINSAFN